MVSCSNLPKPDIKGCFNLHIGGYGGCTTSQTKKRTILPPDKWSEMKAGPGFWFLPEEIAKQKKFILKICEKSKMCGKDTISEINKEFDLFMDEPEQFKKQIKREQQE